MKKFLFVLIAVILICIIIPVRASAENPVVSGNNSYSDNGDGTCTLLLCTYNSPFGFEYDLVIPSTLGNLTVTHIATSAFNNLDKAAKITLPTTVHTIDSGAFYNNFSLQTIDLSSFLEYIPPHMISNCGRLLTPYIPAQTNYIGYRGLGSEDITLPSSTGQWAQGSGGSIVNGGDTVSADFTYVLLDYHDIDNGDGTRTITDYTGPREFIRIPRTLYNQPVTHIGNHAFSDKGLTDVFLVEEHYPHNGCQVTNIGDYAFADNSLNSIVIPEQTTYIGYKAFSGNNFTMFPLPGGTQGNHWLELDENGPTGKIYVGGENVSVSFGYIESTNPYRIFGIPEIDTASVIVNNPYSIDLSTIFEDEQTAQLIYEVSIDGAAFVDAAESFTYTPDTVKDYNLTFRAFDGDGYSDNQHTVILTSLAFPNAPTLKYGVPTHVTQSVKVNHDYEIDLSKIFEGASQYPISYELNLNNAGYAHISENFLFTPTTVGDYTLIFRAYNSAYSVETYEVDLTAMQTYTVTYDPNGAVNGSTAEDSKAYIKGESATVKTNWLNLNNVDDAFSGWNTCADGSGIHFDASGTDTFTVLGNTTLYAEWTELIITEAGTYDVSNFPLLSSGNILRVATTEPVTLTGTAPGSDTDNGIFVKCEPNTNLTLKDFSTHSTRGAVSFEGMNNKLYLDGVNYLEARSGCAGISVNAGSELIIKNAPNKSGSLTVKGLNNAAGIGGDENMDGGTIRIESGEITTNGTEGAGVGGGKSGNSGNITIIGGTITARSSSGAGIGGGRYGDGENMTIAGGIIDASSGDNGAGIGGGEQGSGGNINILNGEITAYGSYDASGIGAGGSGAAGNITISGGTIEARGGDDGNGIGSRTSGDVLISGGNITATGLNNGAGIGCGGGDNSNVTISGGYVNAIGNKYGAGIGGASYESGGNITITGGEVVAESASTGAGIGGGLRGSSGTIKITNGTIHAKGGVNGGAGIGGGNHSSSESITISGGVTVAQARCEWRTAGIGAGYDGSSGSITIKDGAIVFAQGSSSGGPTNAFAIGSSSASGDLSNNVTLRGDSTLVFIRFENNDDYMNLNDGIQRYSDYSDIAEELIRLGLILESPWNSAEKVYKAPSVETAVFYFNPNTTDTVTDMPVNQVVKVGAKAIPPDPPSREGYVFDCWSIDPAGFTPWLFDTNTVPGDIIVFAIWKKEISVNVNAGENGTVSPNGEYTLLQGDDLVITALPNAGCSVDAVTVSDQNATIADNGDGTYKVSNITSDCDIDVTFNPAPIIDDTVYYSVRVKADSNGTVSPDSPQSVPEGGLVTFTAKPNSGYMVDSVTSDGPYASFLKNGNDYSVSNITSPCTIFVTYTPSQHLVEVTSGANGTVLPSGTQEVPDGDSLTIYPLPDTYFAVDEVTFTDAGATITDDGDGSYTISNIYSAGTVNVTFTRPDFDVDIVAGANGSVSPASPQTIACGENLTITPTPDTGYVVDEVTTTSGNTVLCQPGGTYEVQNITEPCTINVTFKLDTYAVSYSRNGGNGSICDQSCTYNETIILSDGAEFSKPCAVLKEWDIGYLGGLYQVSGNETAKAVWSSDADEDGISDDDEIAAGTDPNDPEDKPQQETIKVTVLNSDGSFAENYTVVLNSAPQFNTTSTDGNSVFAGVSLSPHTLSLRDGMNEIGRYTLNFTKGSSNSSSITGGGTGINTTNASNFMSLDFVIKLNAAKTAGTITEVNILERSYTDNPDTGEN